MDDPCGFVEKAGTSSGETGAFPGDGQVLAWEAKCYDAARREVVGPCGAYVVQDHRIRPLGLQQDPAINVLLDLGDDGEPRVLEAEVDSADAREKADKSPAHSTGP